MIDDVTIVFLRGHLVRQDNEKPFFYKECDTPSSQRLHSIYTLRNTQTQPTICDPIAVKDSETWPEHLNNHLIVHYTEKKLICDECGCSTNHLKTQFYFIEIK